MKMSLETILWILVVFKTQFSSFKDFEKFMDEKYNIQSS